MQGPTPAVGTFEYYFAERSMNSWKRVLEKECKSPVAKFVDTMLACRAKFDGNEANLERCITPAAESFARCTSTAQEKWFSPVEGSPELEKLRHCLAMGDEAPKKCWTLADKLFTRLTPDDTYPTKTPTVDRFMAEFEKIAAEDVNNFQR